MIMSNEKNREQIMKFAIAELKKAMEDLKKGVQPTMAELKKVVETIKDAQTLRSENKISDKDIDVVLDTTAKKVSKDK